MLKIFKNLRIIVKQQMRINTLENEKEVLEEIIKNEVYKQFILQNNLPEENERLKKEIKRLRRKLKEAKKSV